MTNEEIIEKTYYKAFKKNLVDELRNEIDRLKKENKNDSLCDIVQQSYKNVKKNKKLSFFKK
jgi:hypothetical protein